MTHDRAVCIHGHFYQPPRRARFKTRRPAPVDSSEVSS
jgi:hypothetical protein